MVGGASILGNCASFLRVDDNKTELFSFLSGIFHDSFQLARKQLVATDGDAVRCKPPLPDITGLAPCNHENADTRMMLHAVYVAHAGHRKLTIRTVNTDVVVLAVALHAPWMRIMKCGCLSAWTRFFGSWQPMR